MSDHKSLIILLSPAQREGWPWARKDGCCQVNMNTTKQEHIVQIWTASFQIGVFACAHSSSLQNTAWSTGSVKQLRQPEKARNEEGYKEQPTTFLESDDAPVDAAGLSGSIFKKPIAVSADLAG
ncbi:hypothetical protein K438DRAFT_1784986 [Mycena galopus ATCC 62051]|nr:hypothetical protein K438DRAFT_1784986 [Mycena galopus ATCC 62051]